MPLFTSVTFTSQEIPEIVLAVPADKDGRDGYQVSYQDGTKIWAPALLFRQAYRPLDAR